jgi:hypothetical protein
MVDKSCEAADEKHIDAAKKLVADYITTLKKAAERVPLKDNLIFQPLSWVMLLGIAKGSKLCKAYPMLMEEANPDLVNSPSPHLRSYIVF